MQRNDRDDYRELCVGCHRKFDRDRYLPFYGTEPGEELAAQLEEAA